MNEQPYHNQPKSFDIIRPGNTPAGPTSRPVIPSNQTPQIDPMINLEPKPSPIQTPVNPMPDQSQPQDPLINNKPAQTPSVESPSVTVVSHRRVHFTIGVVVLILLTIVLLALVAVAFISHSI